MWLKIFIHLAQPTSCNNFVARLRQWFKLPKFFGVERKIIFATLQKHTCKQIEIVLQTVVVTRKQSWPKRYFEQVPHKLNFAANF